ncbi:MAG: RNA-directed DNA polymerase [Lentisphaerae bacterium]|nr:RNA-directed DNA polymerase [Lentisphaerota bacterium]
MKSVGGIWDRLLCLDTFLEAFHGAAKGKATVEEVVSFRRDLHGNTRRMRRQLEAGEYRFGPYSSFMVRDPKPRLIRVAPFEQRVMHHAMVIACGDVFERSLIFDTYACRRGKGQHAAVRRAQCFACKHACYLKMDIRKFYDSIPHECLLGLLRKRLREARVHDLFARLLASHETSSGCGLPIGNLTSQHLGNLCLDGLDHWLTEVRRVPAYVRYMDDMLVFGDRIPKLRELRNETAEWLANERGLTIKHDGEINDVVRGLPFLGVVIRPHGIRLHPRSAQRYSRKLASLKHGYRHGLCDDRELQDRACSLVAATRLADAAGFRRGVERRQTAIKGYT